jgi:hypothetical protein
MLGRDERPRAVCSAGQRGDRIPGALGGIDFPSRLHRQREGAHAREQIGHRRRIADCLVHRAEQSRFARSRRLQKGKGRHFHRNVTEAHRRRFGLPQDFESIALIDRKTR